MSSSIYEIADALRDALSTVPNLRAHSYQPEQINPPMAYPMLSQVDYHTAYNGGVLKSSWTIYAIVGRWIDRTAHENLDGFLSYDGDSSIRRAIEADPTLDGVVQSLILDTSSNINSLSQDDSEFLQISFSLTVYS